MIFPRQFNLKLSKFVHSGLGKKYAKKNVKTYLRYLARVGLSVISFGLVIFSASCATTTTVKQYEATAITTLTWHMKFTHEAQGEPQVSFEEFASSSLTNRNGQQPGGEVVGPDETGLWWPPIPSQPTRKDIQDRQQLVEGRPVGQPELVRTVDYHFVYEQDGEILTLPTNSSVYQQVVQASPEGIPLKLTLGFERESVEQAEPLD